MEEKEKEKMCYCIALVSKKYEQAVKLAVARGYAKDVVDYDQKVRDFESRLTSKI